MGYRLPRRVVGGDERNALAEGNAGRGFRHCPDAVEQGKAVFLTFLIAADEGEHRLMQAIDPRVRVRPRIRQSAGIELAHELLHQGQLQEA